MAGQRKKPNESGVVGRLAGRGEDALTKVMDELGRNPRVTDALSKAMGAKEKVDTRTRKTLGTVGLAAADEIKDLRGQLERLEKRLARLEGGSGRSSGSSSSRSPAKRSSSGGKKSSSSGTSSSAKKSSSSSSPSGGSSSSGSNSGSSS